MGDPGSTPVSCLPPSQAPSPRAGGTFWGSRMARMLWGHVRAQCTRQQLRCPLSGLFTTPALGFHVGSRWGGACSHVHLLCPSGEQERGRRSPPLACPRNHGPPTRSFFPSLGSLLGGQVSPSAGENSSACKFLQGTLSLEFSRQSLGKNVRAISAFCPAPCLPWD